MDINFQHTFGFLMRDVSRLLGRRFEEKARSIGTSLAQSRAIAYLTVHPGINQNCLADFLEIQPISAARLLDRMEAMGWAVRRLDPADRRVRRVYLTEKAHSFFEQLVDMAVENNKEALEGLSPQQIEVLLAMLEQAHANLLRLCKAQAAAKSK